MPSHEAFAIFWAPRRGYSFPSGYKGITDYLENSRRRQAGSRPTSIPSARNTKTSSGHASYEDSYGGSGRRHPRLSRPARHTAHAYEGFRWRRIHRLPQRREARSREVQTVRAEQSWPSGIESEYYVVLPPHVGGSCFGTTIASGCFDKEFCAYHSYGRIPDGDLRQHQLLRQEDPSGCGSWEYPNGTSNGKIDDSLSSLSHEANGGRSPIRSSTPGTTKKGSRERGNDECRNSSDDSGLPSGGGVGSLFNESINGGHYYLQQEWSNDINNCAQRGVGPAKPAIARSRHGRPGADGRIQRCRDQGVGRWRDRLHLRMGIRGWGDQAPAFIRCTAMPRSRTYTVSLTCHRRRRVHLLDVPRSQSHPAGRRRQRRRGRGRKPQSRRLPLLRRRLQLLGPVTPGIAVAAAKAKVKNGIALLEADLQGRSEPAPASSSCSITAGSATPASALPPASRSSCTSS